MASLAPTISSSGISAPDYATILANLQDSARAIFGSDIYIAPDSQDGQLLAIMALAISDTDQAAIGVFNAFSPTYAQGVQLSSVVKINGIARDVPTNSVVDVTIVGQVGTIITNGVVQDTSGNLWNLPASVTIPIGGSIVVTATAQQQGDIATAPSTVTTIYTPTRGWQTVNNVGAAVAGAPVESDADLRQRQTVSTALPAQTVIASISGAIANIHGVMRYFVYENDTDSTDGNGIPSHSISAVVEGGDAVTIAETIASKKTPGTGTYGTTSEIVVDSRGIPSTIKFYQMTEKQVYASVSITALSGYVSTTGDLIKEVLAAWIAQLDIGEDVYITRLYAPITLSGDVAVSVSGQTQEALDALRNTYNVTALTIGFAPSPVGTSDLTIAFNEGAQCAVGNIDLTVA